MFDGKWKAPDLQPLQNKVSNLSPDMKATVYELAEDLLTNAMHDLLFAFQEYNDGDVGIEIMVDGKSIAELSDGLHGEIFGKEGWIVRYSKFPSPTEMAGTLWAEKTINEMLGNGGEGEGEPEGLEFSPKRLGRSPGSPIRQRRPQSQGGYGPCCGHRRLTYSLHDSFRPQVYERTCGCSVPGTPRR